MALQKQNVNVNFSKGLDLKTDPFQLPLGNFLELENSVFNKGGLLQKRNGFKSLPSLPNNSYSYTNTFKDSLVAIGTDGLANYHAASEAWQSKGVINPIIVNTQPILRTSSSQTQVDSAISGNLVCTVYKSISPSTTYNYVISDLTTGQNIVASTQITTISEPPRVFVLTNYFIIVYSDSANLRYIYIPVNNTSSSSGVNTLVTNYAPGALSQGAFDGLVYNDNLYVAYNATDGGGAIRMTYLNSFLVRQTSATGTSIAAAKSADIVCLTSDSVNAQIWVAFYKNSSTSAWVLALSPILNSVLAATSIFTTVTCLNITATAYNGSCTVYYEVSNTYSYGASLATNLINKITTTNAGVVGTALNFQRSVGLASKAFLIDNEPYMLASYSSSYQPSFFLLYDPSVSTTYNARVVSKLAYSNGGGYLTLGLPSASVSDSTVRIPYLIKDLLIPANKSQNPSSSTPVYAQLGINLATFDFSTDEMNASEIGENLHVSGGIMWTYDGYQIVEQGFNVYPDNVVVTTSAAGGSIAASTYYYVAVYEWTDNQGNIHRSAPSLAVSITTTGATSTNTIKVPTLRLTYKSLVKIVLYRWSSAQQVYYQVTSITSPTLNSTTSDNVTITDTQADSSIVGNSILYTTGGVVENIAAPPSALMTLFKARLFVVDAEDRNLIWYSKLVLESTPVEMSDLFTIYVAPTISAQGDTGPITALSAMDDKLIIFKKNAIYYITGNGPDAAGANNDFSEAVLITATVGCDDQNSIVFTPNGLMFQSDKGIWLLGRDISTSYIGAPAEGFNEQVVFSSLVVPGTNQVRFTLEDNTTLMYDYYFNQWGEFSGLYAISSTLYEGLHTFIDSFGRVFQENPGSYLDGSKPVLLRFKTGWINLAGVQGLERAYEFYMLGRFLSPHMLTVQMSYDYDPGIAQSVVITPENYSGAYGNDTFSPIYGSPNSYGGASNREQWRVFFNQQQFQSFQITLQEQFDSSYGTTPGAGFTMSGLNMVVGLKRGWPRLKAGISVG